MIADAAYGGITELVRRHWSYLQLSPEDFRTEPDLLELAATEWTAALLAGQIPWERIPQELHAAPSLAEWKAKLEAKCSQTPWRVANRKSSTLCSPSSGGSRV